MKSYRLPMPCIYFLSAAICFLIYSSPNSAVAGLFSKDLDDVKDEIIEKIEDEYKDKYDCDINIFKLEDGIFVVYPDMIFRDKDGNKIHISHDLLEEFDACIARSSDIVKKVETDNIERTL